MMDKKFENSGARMNISSSQSMQSDDWNATPKLLPPSAFSLLRVPEDGKQHSAIMGIPDPITCDQGRLGNLGKDMTSNLLPPSAFSAEGFDYSSLGSNLPMCQSPAACSAVLVSPDETSSSTKLKKLQQAFSVLSTETYSRKVFVGGLPHDIDKEEICFCFRSFGPLKVDWPYKARGKYNVPSKGYAFLNFKEEASVHKLMSSCSCEGEKYFFVLAYCSMGTDAVFEKKVEIRPWLVVNNYYHQESSDTLECRNAVFVGGVPGSLKASELAGEMTKRYGCVVFAAMECNVDLQYPKGAACVVFETYQSLLDAISSRFMHLSLGRLEKTLELRPYIFDDQMCDKCHGSQSNNKPAPFFCGSIHCLKYYCEHCWATVHSQPDRQSHQPMHKS